MKSVWSVVIASKRNGVDLTKITVLASSVRGALQKGERFGRRRNYRIPWYVSEVVQKDTIEVM